MPGNVTGTISELGLNSYSEALANRIEATDFSGYAATVVGYGNMGRHYVQALDRLGVSRIRVCSRSPEPLEALRLVPNVTTASGGYREFREAPAPGEIAIVSAPTAELTNAARHFADLGFKRIMVEKPAALRSEEIRQLSQELTSLGVDAVCAYNRVTYPSVLEAKVRCDQEGGVTSCFYTFTEFIHSITNGNFSEDDLARWGIANSLHVMSLAHSVIGLPRSWQSHRSGGLPWHPTGSVFVGSGISELGVPFSYHADWGSTGRWSAEFHTQKSSYRLCPLEHLERRTVATGDWKPVSVSTWAADLKCGVAEQVAAVLSEEIRSMVPLVSLEQAAALTEYGENMFGYTPHG